MKLFIESKGKIYEVIDVLWINNKTKSGCRFRLEDVKFETDWGWSSTYVTVDSFIHNLKSVEDSHYVATKRYYYIFIVPKKNKFRISDIDKIWVEE